MIGVSCELLVVTVVAGVIREVEPLASIGYDSSC